jgi:hypothetical protein
MIPITYGDSNNCFATNGRIRRALLTMPYGIVLPSESYRKYFTSHQIKTTAHYEYKSIFDYIEDSVKAVNAELNIPPKHNLLTDKQTKVSLKRFFDNAHYKLLQYKKHHLTHINHWIPTICEINYSPRVLAEHFQNDVREVKKVTYLCNQKICRHFF